MIKFNNIEASSFSLGKILVVVTTSILLSACGGGGSNSSTNSGDSPSNELLAPEGTYDLACHLDEGIEGDDDCQAVLNPTTGEEAVEMADMVASIDAFVDDLYSSRTDAGEAEFILFNDNTVLWDPNYFEETTWELVKVQREIDGIEIGVDEVYLIELPEGMGYNDGIILSKYNGRVVLGTFILEGNEPEH